MIYFQEFLILFFAHFFFGHRLFVILFLIQLLKPFLLSFSTQYSAKSLIVNRSQSDKFLSQQIIYILLPLTHYVFFDQIIFYKEAITQFEVQLNN